VLPADRNPVPAAEDALPAAAAAFFDVDNTVMIGASIYHFARGMAARDLFTWRDLVGFTARQVRLRLSGEHSADLQRSRESALAFVAGKRVADIVALGEEIYDEEMADRIWPGTAALAQGHLEDGRRVWLVTATPVELATIIADRLGLTGALGTVAETVDGVYSGRLVGTVLHGEAKAAAVRALAAQEGLDLAQCWAYSDSINDLPLLGLVGHPVAVNPDSALRSEARARGWEVHDFRTGRKAARVGIPAALGVGAVLGGLAAGLSVRRRLVVPPPSATSPGRPVHRPAARARAQAHTADPAQPRRPDGHQRRALGLIRILGAAGQRQIDRRCTSSRYSVSWIASRTRSVSSKTVAGSSAGSSASWAPRWSRGSMGAPNSMYHLLGSGTSPSGPSHGKVGVIGK
jgi:HAD superfamily hydrolase (TIGR01490 family)